jgi:UDP-glucose 4-epimerase
VEDPGPEHVLTLDLSPPPPSLGVAHRTIDLTEPASDERLLEILREEGVERLVHMAFFTSPRRDAAYAHELESIGTLALLAAAAAAGLERVVLRSYTAVYGARGQNPNFLTESSPLRPSMSLPWARDKYEADQHVQSFETRYPGIAFVRLRFAPLLGPGVHTFYTSVFDRQVVPVPLGYDPLLQLLHPEDALDALVRAVLREGVPSGPLNITPRATVTLLTALHLSEKVPLPVPHAAAGMACDLLWSAGLSPAPGGFLDYVRYLFVADGSRAKKVLGFTPRHTSTEALMGYLRYRRGPVGIPA